MKWPGYEAQVDFWASVSPAHRKAFSPHVSLHSTRRVIQWSLEHLLDRARLIGPQSGSWAQAMAGRIATRVLYGLLSLVEKHPTKALKNTAQKALHHGTRRTLLETVVPSPEQRHLKFPGW